MPLTIDIDLPYREIWDSDPEAAAQPCEHATEVRPTNSPGMQPGEANPNTARTIKTIGGGPDTESGGQSATAAGTEWDSSAPCGKTPSCWMRSSRTP